MVQSKHRLVENTQDFAEWGWGDLPERITPSPDEFIIEQLKEWAEVVADDAHEKSCANGAAVAFAELAENGFFVLRGITDKGLLVEFQGTDSFVICDELEIVDEVIDHFEDPRHVSAHLRRLADAIDAGCQQEQSPP